MTMGDHHQLHHHDQAAPVIDLDDSMEDDEDDDEDTVVGTCLHCQAPPPPRSSSRGSRSSANPGGGGGGGGGPCSFASSSALTSTPTICPPAASRVQVSCDDCRSFICDGCHWCHEFQANHEIRVCDRCDAFYCRGCDEMDQCEDCSEVVCNTCSTLMSCKFCGCGLCEDCATACGRCGIVLCARDAKFAVECDTCRMSYCLVCLASGTKDPCVRCGHRPSKRMEQLVHLRLKSIYKAFKQSGASMGPGSGNIGGSAVSDSGSSVSGRNDGHGKDGGSMGGKYSSALRSLLTDSSDSTKDNVSNFDQSMASEVAAVLQTASNSMADSNGADYADGHSRRSRGKRISSHDLSPSPGSARNRSSSRTSNAAAERYFRKTQAEMEVAAAAAEADAEAAAAALLAELDEEKAYPNAPSKRSKKKKKKKEKTKEIATTEQTVFESSSFTGNVKSAEKDEKIDSSAQTKKSSKNTTLPQKSLKAYPPIEEDSSDEEMNFEQLVGITKSARPSKKEKADETSEEKTNSPSTTPKPEPPPPQEGSTTSTAHFDAELAVLLSNDDEMGLETFLADLKGVPGLGAARKTARKALKRIKEASELFVPSGQDRPQTRTNLNEPASKIEVDTKETKSSAKATASKQTSGLPPAASTGTGATTATASYSTNSIIIGNQHEPLLRVVSRTQSNVGTNSNRGVASNSASVPVSARAECVMHISPAVVGWVIGKGGSRIRDMMEESGAKIWIDQESMGAKESRVVYVSGKRSSVDTAVRMVKDLVAKAPVAASAAASQGVAPVAAPASAPAGKSAPAPPSLTASPVYPLTLDSSKEPTSFAAAITSGTSTPAAATPPGPNPLPPTKQPPASMHGWAIPATGISISASSLPQAASQSFRVLPKPAAMANAGGASLSQIVRSELVCDPRFVALLIGRRGWTVKNIQAESGANLHIDQSVDPPKIIISGKTENVQKAEQMVRDVLKYPHARITPLPSEDIMFNSLGRPEIGDVQIMPQMAVPFSTSLHRDASLSTHKFQEEPMNFPSDGATNLQTIYGQYHQQNPSNMSSFQESSADARMTFILPNNEQRQTLPPPFVNFVDAGPNVPTNHQEWGHQSQASPMRNQYSALPPFSSAQVGIRDQYNVLSIPNAPLTQQSLRQDNQGPFNVPLPPEQRIRFPTQNLEAGPHTHEPPSHVTPARMNVFGGTEISGQTVNGWDSLATSTLGGTWNQSHFPSIPSAPQQPGFQAPAARPLSNNPFQQTETALTSAYNDRRSDDSLMVDNMFASMVTSGNDGDDLLSALNSVSLVGSALQQNENWESKIPGWGGEDASSFLHDSRLGDYRDEG